MLLAGTDDGVYRIDGIGDSGDGRDGSSDAEFERPERVLESDRVMRVRQFDGLAGVFAATKSGLYHSPDGRDWTDLQVPRDEVYAVGAGPSGDCLYAGTFPAHVYACDLPPTGSAAVEDGIETGLEWRELEGFQELPSRDEWHLPRHRNAAQLRDLCTHPDAPDRVVAAVEVGGVHVSEDRGETWAERKDGLHDDVHNLVVVNEGEYVAATGDGLYRTTDVGRSWHRLDGGTDPSYFRMVFHREGRLFTSAAPGPSPTWEGGTDAALFERPDGGSLERIESPHPEEIVIGWTAVDGDVLGATHAGRLLRRDSDGWADIGTVPVPGSIRGRYLPLSRLER